MAFYSPRVLTFCMLTIIVTKDRFNFVTVHFDLLLSPFSKSFLETILDIFCKILVGRWF